MIKSSASNWAGIPELAPKKWTSRIDRLRRAKKWAMETLCAGFSGKKEGVVTVVNRRAAAVTSIESRGWQRLFPPFRWARLPLHLVILQLNWVLPIRDSKRGTLRALSIQWYGQSTIHWRYFWATPVTAMGRWQIALRIHWDRIAFLVFQWPLQTERESHGVGNYIETRLFFFDTTTGTYSVFLID